MFDKVFVPYDLSEPSKKALKWAVNLGCSFNSVLEIFHALAFEKHLVAYDSLPKKEELITSIKTEIDKDVRQLSKKNQKLKDILIHLEIGDPVDATVDKIKETNPDLVIMGTHGWTALKNLLLGSKAEKIIRHSTSPVLVCRTEPHWPPKKILIPVDFSDYTEKALEMASHFKQFGDVSFEIFHAVSLPDIVHYAPQVSLHLKESVQKNLEDNAQINLKELASKHKSLKAKSFCSTGPAAEEICSRAKKINADIIVIPTHGHTGLTHFFLGSIAEHVIRYASCNVLTFAG